MTVYTKLGIWVSKLLEIQIIYFVYNVSTSILVLCLFLIIILLISRNFRQELVFVFPVKVVFLKLISLSQKIIPFGLLKWNSLQKSGIQMVSLSSFTFTFASMMACHWSFQGQYVRCCSQWNCVGIFILGSLCLLCTWSWIRFLLKERVTDQMEKVCLFT